MVNRCRWVPTNNKLYCDYHDKEWGKPIGDDQKLFELLCLESYQSGLSWLTVLNKRQAFNRVFHDYDIERVARFSLSELESISDSYGLKAELDISFKATRLSKIKG